MILEALNDSGAMPDQLQMIDSTIIRAHHQAAGAKALTAIEGNRLPGNRGLKARVLAPSRRLQANASIR